MLNHGRKPFNMTLNGDLVKEAKKKAIDLGKPLYMAVEDALRLAVYGRPETGESPGTEQGAGVTGRESPG